MKNQTSVVSAVTLANAGDLVATIAMGVMGSGSAATFNGSPLTRASLYELAQVSFQGKVSNYLGAR